MTYQLQCLSFPESQIYNMSAFHRINPDLSDEVIRSVRLDGTKVIFAGVKEDYECDANIYKEHFIEYRNRPSQYFDHLDSQVTHYRLWSHNCYFLPTNWMFRTPNKYNDSMLVPQLAFATNLPATEFDFKLVAEECELKQYGHLVAPWGFCDLPDDSDLPVGHPYCSCGSFQGQWQNLDAFKKILGSDFSPGCKHISYMNKLAHYKTRRQKIQMQQDKDREYKSAAIFARSPKSEMEDPQMIVLYANDRSTAQINKWKFYNNGQPIPAAQSWDLIDRMLNNGYLTFIGHKLSNLINFRPESIPATSDTTTDE